MIHAPKNWMHKKRFLEKYELIYVAQGTLYLKIDHSVITLSKNNLLIVPPYKTIMGIKQSDPNTSFYWVDFATDNAENFEVTLQQINLIQTAKFTIILEELISASQQEATRDFTKDSLLLSLLHEVNKDNKRSSPSHLIVSKISNYIEANITEPLTVESVATALNYNKDYLCKVIKEYYGTSLKNYINNQKLKLAKSLLITSNYSISEISDYLGYDDSNLFTKFFKYHEKMSPADYRKIHLG
jgi:YesN/AraC family two-component response regulator